MASVNSSLAQSARPAIQKMAANSTFIAAFEYDQTNLTLTTFLISGAIYQHKFVLPLDWEGLQTAQNHGSRWSTEISGRKLSVRVKSARAPRSLQKQKRRIKHG